MTRERLLTCLRNEPLVRAIEQRRAINTTRLQLHEAALVAKEAGVSTSAVRELEQKADEYLKTMRNYGNMIQDSWGITQWDEAIIAKYVDYTDSEINQLPDSIRA